MSILAQTNFMPSKLKYKLLTAFCLMSLMPLLVGVYVASMFVRFPFDANAAVLTKISLVMAISLFLSMLGYQVVKQLIQPIIDVTQAAKNLASGRLEESMQVRGAEEIEELSKSLQAISSNAKELIEKVERLSQKDKLTGLYNASYIRERLHEEILRAKHFQRPCSFAYMMITNFESFEALHGPAIAEEALKSAAAVITSYISEFDRAARMSKNEFALIFPDKNKKKTIDTMLKMKTELSQSVLPKDLPAVALGISIGISENPLDGVSGSELFMKAQARAASAKAKGSNGIEAFE